MPVVYNRKSKTYSDTKQARPTSQAPPSPIPSPVPVAQFETEKFIPKTEQEKGRVSLAGCIMAGIGVLLCLTGIGAIIGIPIIIAAISNSRREMAQPNHIYEAPCPFCETLLHVPITLPGSNCPACAKRFIVRDGQFIKVE